MDNLIKLKQCLDKLNKNNHQKKKKKFKFFKKKKKTLYFWNKHASPPWHRMIKGNYLEQHKEAARGIYITLITNIKA